MRINKTTSTHTALNNSNVDTNSIRNELLGIIHSYDNKVKTISQDLNLNKYRIINIGKPKDDDDAISKSNLTQSIDYVKNIYDSKFMKIQDILRQPTAKVNLVIHEIFKKEITGEVFIRREYQNIHCVYGRVEILSPKLITPILILPDPHNVKNSFVVQAICTNDLDKSINFINGFINGNTLTFYPGVHLKLNIKTSVDINFLVSIPGKFPLHTNL